MNQELKTEIQENEFKRDIFDKFLVNNKELEILTSKLSEFNIFTTLRSEKVEIRHSNVISWLLDPSENHQLDDIFLRKFLSTLLIDSEKNLEGLTPSQIELCEFNFVDVRREWKKIDIFMEIEISSIKPILLVIIENKINSKQGKDQLANYYQTVSDEYDIDLNKRGREKYIILPIFLTLEDETPNDDRYLSLNYFQIIDVLESIIKLYNKKIPTEPQLLINHYLTTLRKLTMTEKEMIKLCKDIYRKHHNVFDYVMEYVGSSHVLEVCENYLNQSGMIEVIDNGRQRVFFITNEMKEVIRETDLLSGWSYLPKCYPILWWYHYNKHDPKNKLQLTLEVGPIKNSELRVRLLRYINESSFTSKGITIKEDGKFTRLVTKTKLMKSLDDDEIDENIIIENSVSELWGKVKFQDKELVEILREFKW